MVLVGLGKARRGGAWRCLVRRGLARSGAARQTHSIPWGVLKFAWPGSEGLGKARLGTAWQTHSIPWGC
jgi:hypothetical protein